MTGLGKALQKRGHLVEIILPKYDCMQYDGIGNLRVRKYFSLSNHWKNICFMNLLNNMLACTGPRCGVGILF